MADNRNYEAMLVFSLKNGEESAQELVAKFKELVENNGTIEKFDDWGKRRLAYPINDELDGHYVLINYSAAPEFPAEFERVLKITDGVLRFLNLAK
ncbi:MAG: 30S ribosomal protein S6 [Acutalibacteraceae bacterium]|jgi:small subunit ribosomal protein S6|nr:30S ribosomal protein S6 [Clostridiales bacterium]